MGASQGAGSLQLADVATSAIYGAIQSGRSPDALRAGQALGPILGRRNGSAKDYGLVLQPTPPKRADLVTDQRTLFRHFGYSNFDAGPGSTLPNELYKQSSATTV